MKGSPKQSSMDENVLEQSFEIIYFRSNIKLIIFQAV